MTQPLFPVRPHDLLWGLLPEQLPATAPNWARAAMTANEPVVVRRALAEPGFIAIGLRGRFREERLGTWMRLDQITRVVPPEALVTAELMPRPHIRVYAALRWLKPHLAATGLAWGITGSTGFELATGIATLHPESDLDLLLRTPAPVTHTWAKDLVHILDQAPCHIDVQLDTPFGGIALREWARSPAQVLIKKSSGACLVRDPWHSAEHAA